MTIIMILIADSLVFAPHSQHSQHDEDYPSQLLATEYDYIIIGGGTSGLTVGDRLTEGGKHSLLVLEYGYFDTQVNMAPRRMFNITSEMQPNLRNRTFQVGIGCVVGGSSIVNGQVFLRGSKPEYDAWKELGGPNSTWDWNGLLPYFRKGITLSPPDPEISAEFNMSYNSKYYGKDARVYATFSGGRPEPFMKNLYNAMAKMPGMTIPEDSGSGEAGLYWYPISQDGTEFKRSSSRTGHWDGLNRANYEMLTGAKVNKINFNSDKKAISVQFISRNDSTVPPVTTKARKQVILAAGSIHTPQILLQSGIGPAKLLKEYNISVVEDLPGVGSNFQDHSYIPQIAYKWGITPNGSLPKRQDRNPWGKSVPPTLAAMIGMPVVSPEKYEALSKAFENQDPASHLPATYTKDQIEGYKQQQKVYSKLFREKNMQWNEMMMFGPGGSIQNLHPLSRGLVLPPKNDLNAEMTVDYRAATNAIDVDVMVEIIKFMRRYMTESDLKVWAPEELSPGVAVTSDNALKDWARDMINPSVYHPVGTAAKMPREWGGVVDEELAVHGLKDLTIVDASIMPTLIGATTSMTVYACAEKAADIIKAKTGW
ncbi:alcohol oxidase [Lindgomyces ingoldianus]|uniref:Alcohol oxidase n=1 Tax=Lindgomyces ingoldianus TaxID=673940 RepID=A0ACB6QWP9_9PLEO|nr:alcohol oxidase [Lindgomyces ingoldianus]KAF2471433.1 alcohol oxidase [Lindgomyces ingoldianus]